MSAQESSETSVFLPLEGYFRGAELRTRILLCQLPITGTVLLFVGVIALLYASTLHNGLLLVSLLIHGLIFIICLVAPWKRLPAGSFALIPVLDCPAIVITAESGDPVLRAAGVLMVLPVTWLAAGTTKTRVLLAIAAALGSTVLPPGILGYSPPTSELVRVVIFPGIMAALAITADLVTRTVTRHRALLEVKDRGLERLYQQSGERQRLLDGVVETVSVGVWALDGDGADILINERARTARTQASQARERGHAALTEETIEDPETKSPMDRAVQGEEFSEELFWVGSGEARRAYSATARGLRDEEGRPAGAVVALTDVTALIQAMTVKDKFVATISMNYAHP